MVLVSSIACPLCYGRIELYRVEWQSRRVCYLSKLLGAGCFLLRNPPSSFITLPKCRVDTGYQNMHFGLGGHTPSAISHHSFTSIDAISNAEHCRIISSRSCSASWQCQSLVPCRRRGHRCQPPRNSIRDLALGWNQEPRWLDRHRIQIPWWNL